MSEINKKGAGRPFKMGNFLDKLQEVLEEENILFLTEKDLLFLVNERLDEKDQITLRTFQNWKGGDFHENELLGKEFIKCVEKALIRQKQYLGQMMLKTNNSSWTKYAWALERKFDEFNLKHIRERINKNENTNIIQITAGNEEQRKVIENLMNAQTINYQEIPVPQLKSSNNPELDDNNDEGEEYEF